MYEPPLHRENDLAKLHELIRARPLGLLMSHGPEGLVANAIPFLLDADASKLGKHAFARVCPAEKVHTLVTDETATDADIAPFRAAGVEVLRV